jgi:dienelactone hydrolase
MNNRYEPDAADDARRRILAFFGKHLSQDAPLPPTGT